MEYIFFFILVISFTYIANKKSYLPNYTGDEHQKFLNSKTTPLIGGFFLLICLIKTYYSKDLIYILTFVSIFIIGYFSDSKLLSSPKLRLFLQLIIVSLFVIYFQIHVSSTRIEFFDNILQKNHLSLIFTIFCLMILINGSNFIDGLNGLLLGYFFMIFFVLNINDISYALGLSKQEITFIIFSLSLVLILNYLNLLYLGDGGSYLISLFFGYLLISLYNLSTNISPYYIILILWYPCFETLFSLIRKLIINESPMKPDNHHLHQLIFFYYKYKLNFKNDLFTNIFSSFLINGFNFVIFYFGSKNPNLTILQLKLILVSVFAYCFFYFLLKNQYKLISKK